MKKSFLALVVVVALGFASQSCETSSSLEDVVVQQDNGGINNTSGAQDQTDVPGGGDGGD